MRQVSEQFASDVIITAIEGGIGYWANVLEYRHTPEPATAKIREQEATDPKDNVPKEATLNREFIQKGIDALASGAIKVNPRLLGNILVGAVTDDAGEVDSDGADVIVQAALFGELVYG
jgi:hypothetical protein